MKMGEFRNEANAADYASRSLNSLAMLLYGYENAEARRLADACEAASRIIAMETDPDDFDPVELITPLIGLGVFEQFRVHVPCGSGPDPQ
jgi:hypothetical protein